MSTVATRENSSDAHDWWDHLDQEVLACLVSGPKSVAQLAWQLELSESSVTSLLLLLAAEGKVRIGKVRLTEAPHE